MNPHLDDDVVKSNVWDFALLGRMLRYARPYWRRILLGLLFVALSSSLFVSPPLLVGALVVVVALNNRVGVGPFIALNRCVIDLCFG